MRSVLAVASLLAGCQVRSSLWCDMTADCPAGYECRIDEKTCYSLTAPDAAPIPCDDNLTCPMSRPFCDTISHSCKQCGPSETSRCTGLTPYCSPSFTCIPCAADDQCTSLACMPDGSCADANDVLYAAANAPDNNCDFGAPCNARRAVSLMTPTRNIIRFTPERHDVMTLAVITDGTMLGRGAELRFISVGGPVISVSAMRTLNVYYLTISNADGAAGAGDGIICQTDSTVRAGFVTLRDNDDVGIEGVGCTIEVDQSILFRNKIGVRGDALVTMTGSILREQVLQGVLADSGNGRLNLSRTILYQNFGGGVQIQNGANYLIENSIFVLNGGAGSPVGAINVDSTGPNKTFRFNTVANNTAIGAAPAGMRCGVLGATGTSSNIFVANTNGTEATCAITYSLYDVTPPPGTGNVMGNPVFRNTTPDIITFPPDFYRIGPASAALDVAEPIAAVTIDIDGEARPEGTGRDIGADERHP